MSLSPEQIVQLSDVLVTKFDATGVDLDRVVKFNLGTGLFVDYAGPGLPFRTVVSQLLEKTEQKGSTIKLFAGVIRSRPDAKDAVAHILPEACKYAPEASKQVADVVEGVRGIQARLQNVAVRDRILNSFDDLQRVVLELDLLARYKTLHDCLQNLQIKHYRQVASAAKRFKEDPSAKDTLGEYLQQLRMQSSNARSAVLGLPNASGERDKEMPWINELESIIQNLHAALIHDDERAAVKCSYGLKDILRKRPRHLDEVLVGTAERVPLTRLVDSLKDVRAAFMNGDNGSFDLGPAIRALERLIPDQRGLIAVHTAWQDVDTDFWQADASLHAVGNPDSLEEFQYLWESLWKKMLVIIASNPQAAWAVSLDQQGRNFLKTFPLPDPVPDRAKASFGLLQRDAMYQFFEVDKSLHNQCNEIIKIGEPLQRLLEEASNDHH
jgi:hypothetical protein